jgi:hypothetical protein
MVWPFDEEDERDAAAAAASAGAEPIYIPPMPTPLVSRKLRRYVMRDVGERRGL